MIRRPKLRIVNSPTARTTTTTTPIAEHDLDRRRQAVRKLQKPAASPRMAIAKRSRTRSMKTVPNVRLSEAVLLILSR